MGKRGPKPMPSATQKRLGTYRADRRAGEIIPAAESPKVPTWVKGRARKCWKEIAPILEENNLLTRLDQVALALLVAPLADYILSREIVEEAANSGDTRFLTTTDKGNIIQHPAVGVMNKAWEKVLKVLIQFGMTPSARASLATATKKPPADPMGNLLRRIAQRN